MTDFEPFDLKRAEEGEPVMFRGSTSEVTFKCALHDGSKNVRAILFVRTDKEGEYEITRSPDGMFYNNSQYSPLDIVMKPKPPATKTFWACFDLDEKGDYQMGFINTKPSQLNWQYCLPIEVTLPPTKR